ncbi:hypothetical protein KEM48_009543 [Puccinia striiformis f. sp. tritici PST-130]|nr:hypothetical protein KEM48_009543 [Puccinia striiformis f. sp. tritici PST-130]
MSNIPRSPNGQFARQPLNQTPNSRIPPLAPILDLPQVRVQRGSGDSTTLSTSMISRTKSSTMTKKRRFDLRIWMAKRYGDPFECHSRGGPSAIGDGRTQLVSASSLAPPRPRPAFCTPEMKKPDSFDSSSPAKLHNYLQQCKLIFRNDIDSFSSDLKKTLYAAAFLTGKALNGSSSEPMQWLSKKTLWTFKISSFPIFSWECLVIDATGNDDAILGYDFLTHWNPDINWSEGLIIPRALPPAAPIKLLSSSSSQEPSA